MPYLCMLLQYGLMRERKNLRMCSITEKQPFIIRNSCGLQLKFSSSKEIFELNDASTATLFIRLPDQSLKHLPSGNCVKPTAYANSANVAKAVNCSGDDTKFKQESNFAMKHVNTGKCIHPKGGSLTPSQGTNIVIYDGCNHIFQFVHGKSVVIFINSITIIINHRRLLSSS